MMFNVLKFTEKKVLVLMYHRVANTEIDPWELTVTPENFEAQLKVLKKYNVISLEDLSDQISDNKIKKNSIVITFDDGYIDNFSIAKPLLEKYKLPATFFITSMNINNEKEFWWDELAHIIFSTDALPEVFELKSKDLYFELREEARLTDPVFAALKSYSVYRSEPTLRTQLYYTLWEKMHPLLQKEQEEFMDFIRSWANVPESRRDDFLCMSENQIVEIANNKLFTIGGHTNSHPALPFHDKNIQAYEVKENKRFLENLTGTPIDYFSYPSGKFNEQSIIAVQEAGFKAAVTTDHIPVKKTANCFTFGRFQVNNWSGITFKKKIEHWFKQ